MGPRRMKKLQGMRRKRKMKGLMRTMKTNPGVVLNPNPHPGDLPALPPNAARRAGRETMMKTGKLLNQRRTHDHGEVPHEYQGPPLKRKQITVSSNLLSTILTLKTWGSPLV